MADLRGQVAVVTGAGRGIGQGIATLLAKRGARVGVLDVDPSLARETAAQLGIEISVDLQCSRAALSEQTTIALYRMVQEARQNEAADKQRREVIEVKNNADNLVYQTEKALRDLGDKVPAAERGSIETQINDLKQAAQGEDVANIKKNTETLQNAFHALSQKLYSQGGPQGQGQPEGGQQSTPQDGDVIDGEVKE